MTFGLGPNHLIKNIDQVTHFNWEIYWENAALFNKNKYPSKNFLVPHFICIWLICMTKIVGKEKCLEID